MNGECDGSDLECEGRVDSDAERDDLLSETERGFDCGVLDSESDESVTFDLGCSDGTGFDFDSESDVSLDFEEECGEYFSGHNDAADCGLDPESIVLDLIWDCNGLFSGSGDATDFDLDSESDGYMEDDASGRSFAADFGLSSDFAAHLDIDGECSDLDRVTGISDLTASLDRVTE